MRSMTNLAVVALLLAVGCNRTSPAQIRDATVSFGGYHFIFEYPEGMNYKTDAIREDDGRGHVTEKITATCGTHVLWAADRKRRHDIEQRASG